MPRLNEWDQPIGPELPDWAPPPAPSRKAFEGRFCRVEPLEPDRHGRELFEANGESADGRSWTYLPYGPFERFDEYVTWLGESCMGGDPLFFAIVAGEGRTAVGVASYMRIQRESGSIEVGHLNFASRLQRSPAATEAMYLMMKNAFELGYRRYEWKCDALNQPSRRAAERLGFAYEGTFRNATVYKNRSRDTVWYSIIDSEWPALEGAFTEWLDPKNFDAALVQRTRLSELTRGVRFDRTPRIVQS